MPKLAGLLFLCLAVTASGALEAQARLTARPKADAALGLPAGISKVADGAFAYSPPLPANARPGVLVLFHGAGGDARRFIELFRGEADRRGMLLLSIQSTGRTWDVVLKNSRSDWEIGRAAPMPRTGADARRVNAALAALFRSTAVDPQKVLAAGFSDGASYALSLGLENDQLFRGIVALSPGFAGEAAPGRPQRIAIAHGQFDQVLSYARAQGMARDLGDRGYPVDFLSFPSDHMVDRGSLSKALDFVLAPAGG